MKSEYIRAHHILDEQEVVGLFLNYDAGASFTNQEPAPLNMKLAFTDAHVTAYDIKSAQVMTSLAKLTGDKLVKQFVAFCACELKFLYGCSVPWDKLPVAGQSASADQGSDPSSVAASRSPSPKPKLTQAHLRKPKRKHHLRKPKRKHFPQEVKKVTTVTTVPTTIATRMVAATIAAVIATCNLR